MYVYTHTRTRVCVSDVCLSMSHVCACMYVSCMSHVCACMYVSCMFHVCIRYAHVTAHSLSHLAWPGTGRLCSVCRRPCSICALLCARIPACVHLQVCLYLRTRTHIYTHIHTHTSSCLPGHCSLVLQLCGVLQCPAVYVY
jgi:hypothetical protein